MTASTVGGATVGSKRQESDIACILLARDRVNSACGPFRPQMPRLDVLKALGDNTRYAIYLELARSPVPLATADIAETLGAAPQHRRPHLERMRDVGLLHVDAETRARWAAPSTSTRSPPRRRRSGLEPPSFAVVGPHAAAPGRAGRRSAGPRTPPTSAGRRGRADADRYQSGPIVAWKRSSAELDRVRLRSDVADGVDDDTAVVAFAHCPFRELAEANPDVVCSLHRGLVEGFVDAVGGAEVERFLAGPSDPLSGDRRDAGTCIRSKHPSARRTHRDHAHRHRRHQGQGTARCRGRAGAGTPGRRTPRRLLGLLLRDVLRRRRRRRRPADQLRRRARSSSIRRAPSCSRAPRSTTRTASSRPGSRSTTRTPAAPAAAVQSFS